MGDDNHARIRKNLVKRRDEFTLLRSVQLLSPSYAGQVYLPRSPALHFATDGATGGKPRHSSIALVCLSAPCP